MEEDFLAQVKGRDVDLVVCSDAEAILGIGDQGVGVSVHFISRHKNKYRREIYRGSEYAIRLCGFLSI